MNKELEIRAAKALGFYIDDNGEWDSDGDIVLPSFTEESELKFTTSYDWAMLLVAFVNENVYSGYCFSLINSGNLQDALDITKECVKNIEDWHKYKAAIEESKKPPVKSLNVRACEALGCKVLQTFEKEWCATELPEALISMRSGYISLFENSMKFDQDYNWAMLGVKECEGKGYCFFIESHCITVEKNSKSIYESDLSTHEVDGFVNAEQITQAWVEVLEDKLTKR